MKPQTALNIEYSVFKKYTKSEVAEVRDEWLAAYRELEKRYPDKKEICDFLTERIVRAADIFINRYVASKGSDAISHDDYYYEWLEEIKQEENGSLDGDFPLGNEADMSFALAFFSLGELAMLQAGLADRLEDVQTFGDGDMCYARMGFLAELKGRYREAVDYYSKYCGGVTLNDNVRIRCDAIKTRSVM